MAEKKLTYAQRIYRECRAAGVCVQCRVAKATNHIRCPPCHEYNRQANAERNKRLIREGKCTKCGKLKTECKCGMHKREYMKQYRNRDTMKVRNRENERTRYAIIRLMRELYGACWPRPHCGNSCQSPTFDTGTPRIWYKQKYCATCAILTWDFRCMCCRGKTQNIYNRAEIIRQRWKVAEQVEDGTIPLDKPEPEPKPEPEAEAETPRTFCYFCGQESRKVICKVCEPKAAAACGLSADVEGPDETGDDAAFARKRDKPAFRGHNYHDAKYDKVQKQDKETSRVAAISKRNAYAAPQPEVSTLKDADKKFDAIARVKERAEHKPSEVVDIL